MKKAKKGLFSHLKKKENKNNEWKRIKKELNPIFIDANLYDVCELGFEEVCIGNALPLSYAHSKKRADIAKDEPERTRELKEVIRTCAKCHYYIEYQLGNDDMYSAKEKMYLVVTECIKRRQSLTNIYN
jgi:hypothetical protein